MNIKEKNKEVKHIVVIKIKKETSYQTKRLKLSKKIINAISELKRKGIVKGDKNFYPKLATKLKVDYKTSKKYISDYEIFLKPNSKEGLVKFISHGNTGNKAHNRKLEDKEIDKLYNYYFDSCVNIQEFLDDETKNYLFSFFYRNYDVKSRFNISYSTMHSYLLSRAVPSPKSHRTTKRLINRTLKKLISNSDTKTDAFIKFLKKQLKKLENVRPAKNYKGIPGDIVELDACKHRWNNETFHIYIAVDRATGCIVAVAFGKEEDNNGYLELITRIVKNVGAPREIRTDKRTTFWNTHGGETQFSMMIREDIGTILKCSSIPTFKALVERTFDTMQNDYVQHYFMKRGIKTLEEAIGNEEDLMNGINQYYNKSIDIAKSSFMPLPESVINELCFYKSVRLTDKQVFSFNGKKYALFNKNNKRVGLAPQVIKVRIKYGNLIEYI
ncbi:MAG: hypothetical protein KAG14_03340, partial [Mycoplasmataceae bacterium]|nr:hypothetical protein [Mycoplasmataceae bacterium]